MAEKRGFEPPVPFGTQSFQDCTINRSDTSPLFHDKDLKSPQNGLTQVRIIASALNLG